MKAPFGAATFIASQLLAGAVNAGSLGVEEQSSFQAQADPVPDAQEVPQPDADVPGAAEATPVPGSADEEPARKAEKEAEKEKEDAEASGAGDDGPSAPAGVGPESTGTDPGAPEPESADGVPAAAPEGGANVEAPASGNVPPGREAPTNAPTDAPTKAADTAAGAATGASPNAAEAGPSAPPSAAKVAPAEGRQASGVRIAVSKANERGEPSADEPGTDDRSVQEGQPPGALMQLGGLSVRLSTRMSVGQSIFQTGNEFERDPRVSWGMSLSPGYLFSDMTRVGASIGFNQELTTANGDDDPQTIILGDTMLSLSRPLYAFEGGPQLFGMLSSQIPTSDASRVATLVTSLGGRLTLAQPVAGLFVSLGSGFRKNFHRYTHPTRDPNTGQSFINRDGLVFEDLRTGLARDGGSELSGSTYFEGSMNNTSMVLSNSLSVFYPAGGGLGLGAAYNLSHSWTYESFELDELSGVGAREGRGRRDSHGGTFFLNYIASANLALSFSMATGGPTRTADDRRIRFPFFNFEGAESNMTSFTFGVTLTESVPL